MTPTQFIVICEALPDVPVEEIAGWLNPAAMPNVEEVLWQASERIWNVGPSKRHHAIMEWCIKVRP